MKMIASWGLMLWLSLILEHSHPAWFPSVSLLMPLAVGCVFWFRSGVGITIAGLAMVTQWMLNPTVAPVEVVVVLVLAALLVTRREGQHSGIPDSGGRQRHADWVHPVFVLLVGLAFHVAIVNALTADDGVSAMASRLLIALPSLAIIIFATKIADEFGVRQRVRV